MVSWKTSSLRLLRVLLHCLSCPSIIEKSGTIPVTRPSDALGFQSSLLVAFKIEIHVLEFLNYCSSPHLFFLCSNTHSSCWIFLIFPFMSYCFIFLTNHLGYFLNLLFQLFYGALQFSFKKLLLNFHSILFFHPILFLLHRCTLFYFIPKVINVFLKMFPLSFIGEIIFFCQL